MPTLEENLAELYQLETVIINASAILQAERAKLEKDLAEVDAKLLALCPEERTKSVALTETILQQGIARGQSVRTEHYRVKYTKGYPRVTYDNKKMDQYARTHEEVLEFRKETWVKPKAPAGECKSIRN